VEVKKTADIGLVVVHACGEEGSFSWEVLDEDPHEMTLYLFMCDSVDKYVGLALVRQPILQQNRAGLQRFRIILSHQYNTWVDLRHVRSNYISTPTK
jgi:hypothetical protein